MSASSSDATKQGRVVVVGSANQDLTAYTATVPKTGETVLGESFETSFGGKGANQGVAAASLDIAPVSMVCKVGADAFGTELLESFQKVNLQYDETSVVAPNVSTGVAQIIVDTKTGDNMIIVVPGANHALTSSDVRTAITSMADDDSCSKCPMTVVVQLEIKPEVALEALKVAKEVGATTIFNPAPAPEGWLLDADFYKYSDIVIPNETELRSLCRGEESVETDDEEAMARTLFARGVSNAVIVTLGARGAMVVSKCDDVSGGTSTEFVCAPPELPCNSDPVVDTVGAGDSFCGSLSAYLSAGLSLGEAATKACGVASMSVRKRGAQSSYPSAAELPDALKVTAASAEVTMAEK